MRLNVTDIMRRVATTVNQEATEPSSGSAEYLLWLEYINRSIQEWAEANDWESLRKDYWPAVSGATVTLPLDFRKVAGNPRLYANINGPEHYSEDLEEQVGLRNTTDKYFHQLGNVSDGFSLVFYPATLASGASLVIPYYSIPTSLASGSQVPVVDDSQFVVERTIAYILESRSDARFQVQENRARERLLGMIENANLAKYSSYAGPNQVIGPERKQGFRIGRD